MSVFLSDVETGVWPAGAVAGVAAASARLLVTQGPLGHTEVNASGTFHFDASPVGGEGHLQQVHTHVNGRGFGVGVSARAVSHVRCVYPPGTGTT